MSVQPGWPDLSSGDRRALMRIAERISTALTRIKQDGPRMPLFEDEEALWDDLQDELRDLLCDLMHCFPENRLGADEFTFRGIRVLIDIDHQIVRPRDIIARWNQHAVQIVDFLDLDPSDQGDQA